MSKSTIFALVVFTVGLLAFLALVSGGPALFSLSWRDAPQSSAAVTELEIEPGTWIAYEEPAYIAQPR